MASAPLRVACFGEILWDCLPRGIFLGGAPLNVAYHLSRQRVQPVMISAVGRDFLGDEAMRRIATWGIDTAFIARVRQSTGTVLATLDDDGAAHYKIATVSAWDFVPAPRQLREATPSPHALVHGTLALRSGANRKTLERLIAAWPETLRVVDLNLRAPHDDAGAIACALAGAGLVKLNDSELARLARVTRRTPDGWAAAAQRFARRHRVDRVCVTAGARGAGLLWEGDWLWCDARAVKVRDTVGAGDAFLAALLSGLLMRKASPGAALAQACRVGEFVASQDGATPAYRCDDAGRPVAV